MLSRQTQENPTLDLIRHPSKSQVIQAEASVRLPVATELDSAPTKIRANDLRRTQLLTQPPLYNLTLRPTAGLPNHTRCIDSICNPSERSVFVSVSARASCRVNIQLDGSACPNALTMLGFFLCFAGPHGHGGKESACMAISRFTSQTL